MARRRIAREQQATDARASVADRTVSMFEGKANGAAPEERREDARSEWPKILLCPHCKTRQFSSAAVPIDKTARACIKCGAALSALNRAPDQTTAGGVSEKPASGWDDARPVPASAEDATLAVARSATTSGPGGTIVSTKARGLSTDARASVAEGDAVTVTWGKELFTPKQFHTYEVGPFAGTTTVRPGETRAEAAGRLLDDLRLVAEAERSRKMKSFLAALGEQVAYLKGAAS